MNATRATRAVALPLAVALAGFLVHLSAAAGSPFATGANQLAPALLTILTPVAGIAVMATGVAAWFGKVSWWWFVGVLLGTVLVFGSSQIVSWVRGLFGV